MIDWMPLAAAIGARLGHTPDELCLVAMAGGDINRAFRLEGDGHRYFVKLNNAALEAMFIAERRGLEALRQSGAIRVPEVYLTGREGRYAYIVMEYIDLAGRADGERLARALAALHACTQPRFGFECDNTIGSSPQPNPPSDDWIEFWRESRLGFQLQLARDNGLDAALVERGWRLAECLSRFFSGYRPRPSLLHGDLWSGNQGADRAGNPVIFDPACYYGDHETDLAMMELFGHPGERFFAAYHECFPIDDGYPLRRDLYNLYHVLNHANLFGGDYPAQARAMIDRLLG